MENKDCDIPDPIKWIGWGVVGLVILYFCKEFLKYPDAKSFLEGQGSLIAGGVAFIAAVIALRSQRESTQKQIDAQRSMEDRKLLSLKVEETYSAVEGLRIKVLLTRPDTVKNTVLDIDVFNHDLGRILMLCRLYGVVDKILLENYKTSVENLLKNWSLVASNNLKGVSSGMNAQGEHIESFQEFIYWTNSLLEYLSSINRE